MRTLYEINKAYANLWDLVTDFDGDDLDIIENGLQSIEGELAEKCANGIGLIRSLDNLALGMKAEADRLDRNRKIIENRTKRIKDWYMQNLIGMGVKSVPTRLGKMSVCKAGGKRGLEITDKAAILKTKYTTEIPATVEIDSDALRKALESGLEIPGARLKEQGRYLKIS